MTALGSGAAATVAFTDGAAAPRVPVALCVATLLAGCAGADWSVEELVVTADGIGFQPGEPVAGEVIAPEGEISVTLVPARPTGGLAQE